MTRIPEHDQDVFEQLFYLPMLLTILERDLMIFEQSPLKIKKPYIVMVEETMKKVQKDLKEAQDYMKANKMKISELKREGDFTMYSFIYKGYEERKNYFSYRLKNRTEELLRYYLNKH